MTDDQKAWEEFRKYADKEVLDELKRLREAVEWALDRCSRSGDKEGWAELRRRAKEG